MTSKMAQGGAWLAACLASGAGMAFASDAGMSDCAGVAGARVDLVQGQVTPVVKGLSMANGVVRAPDGSYYASDNLALSLDRVSPSGVVQRKWLNLNSNGLALSRDGRTLFVNQFMPAAIKAVNLATGQSLCMPRCPCNARWQGWTAWTSTPKATSMWRPTSAEKSGVLRLVVNCVVWRKA